MHKVGKQHLKHESRNEQATSGDTGSGIKGDTEPHGITQNHVMVEADLEVIRSNLPAQEEPPRASCPGLCSDLFAHLLNKLKLYWSRSQMPLTSKPVQSQP